MSYLIKLDDEFPLFNLYHHGKWVGSERLIGQHLLYIGRQHGIDLSGCYAESHMWAVLNEHVLVEISEE